MVKVALAQFQGSADKEVNLAKAKQFMVEARETGAEVICFHELFNTVYFCVGKEDPESFRLAEPVPGPSTRYIGELCARERIAAIAPLFEMGLKGQYFNTAVVIGPDGEVVGKYRKTSIPFTTGRVYDSNEKFYFTPGDLGLPVFRLACGITLGLLICYDRHFPEKARVLALKGADLIFIPASAATIARDIWEVNLRARAAENLLYIGAANRVGRDVGGSEVEWFGSSMFVDPGGRLMARASDKSDGLLCVEIDLEFIGEMRRIWGVYRDRRPELYSLLSRAD